VICRIIEILANSNNSEVLQEDGVTTEQYVVGSSVGNTTDRRIYITVSPSEEYLALLVLPTMVKKAIEIKTARDEDGKFNKALEKGRSQIVGHLGKRLLYAFDFAERVKWKCFRSESHAFVD
jgi:hypothetical protein